MLELNQKAIAKFDSDLYGSLTIWRDEQGRTVKPWLNTKLENLF